MRNVLLRALLRRVQLSFVDADKAEYDGIDLAAERRHILSAPGCTFTYAHIDLDAWLRDAVFEFDLPGSTSDYFDELEYAQLQIAFYGPDAPCEAVDLVYALLSDDEERRNYFNGLLFMYHTHMSPFRRLEAIVVHFLTTGAFLCYNTSSTSYSGLMLGAKLDGEMRRAAP